MKKLISMTDFVIDRFNERNEDYDILVYNYANFLKKPLELWMFVPCDENGNVLEEPESLKGFYETDNEGMIQECILQQKFQQAKERCLFEGLEINLFTNGRIRFYNKEKELSKMYSIVFDKNGIIENKTDIESICKYPITLTQTAIKQIGL